MHKTVKEIEFIEETHTYLLDGIILPSVSSIIKDDTYASIPPHILEFAANRGKAIHLATEMIDKGKKHNLDTEFQAWLIQYLLFQRMHDFKWLGIEEIVHTNEYAGTIDRIGEYQGKILIADIKNTSKLYEDKLALQLGAYIYAHSHLNGNEVSDYVGAVIWLKKDKWEFRLIEPNIDGFLQKLEEYKSKEELYGLRFD